MSSDSNQVNFSGQIKVEPIRSEDGQPAIQVSGHRGSIISPNLAVSGTSIVATPTGEARVQIIESTTTITIGSINAPTTINQIIDNKVTDFNEVLATLDTFELQDKEAIRNAIIQLRDKITSETPEQSRSRLSQIDDKLKQYPGLREMIIAAATRVFTECLKHIDKS